MINHTWYDANRTERNIPVFKIFSDLYSPVAVNTVNVFVAQLVKQVTETVSFCSDQSCVRYDISTLNMISILTIHTI